jgi:type II secretory pathway pseudopilin PulG
MLMLFVTLLAIAAAAVAPTIAFQVRRDREEEMIHRGVQYSRAIRRYVKKTGRYPSRLEELENTNNIRFLRKRYKDPVTGKDFKILHIGDVQLTGAAGIAGAASIGGGMAPGASPLGGATAAGGPAGTAAASMLLGAAANQGASAAGATPAVGGAADTPGQDAGQANAGSSSGQSQDQSQDSKSGQSGLSASGDKLSSTVFGGGPIVGVASISKAQTIREFNHKNHYNQWQFIYDPTMDRGGLITTPAQPPLQVNVQIQQPNSSGQNPSMPGASGFGTSNSGASGSSNGPQSAQPAQPAQQQQ